MRKVFWINLIKEKTPYNTSREDLLLPNFIVTLFLSTNLFHFPLTLKHTKMSNFTLSKIQINYLSKPLTPRNPTIL